MYLSYHLYIYKCQSYNFARFLYNETIFIQHGNLHAGLSGFVKFETLGTRGGLLVAVGADEKLVFVSGVGIECLLFVARVRARGSRGLSGRGLSGRRAGRVGHGVSPVSARLLCCGVGRAWLILVIFETAHGALLQEDQSRSTGHDSTLVISALDELMRVLRVGEVPIGLRAGGITSALEAGLRHLTEDQVCFVCVGTVTTVYGIARHTTMGTLEEKMLVVWVRDQTIRVVDTCARGWGCAGQVADYRTDHQR